MPRLHVRINSGRPEAEWKAGKVFFRVGNNWRDAVSFYVRRNGTWVRLDPPTPPSYAVQFTNLQTSHTLYATGSAGENDYTFSATFTYSAPTPGIGARVDFYRSSSSGGPWTLFDTRYFSMAITATPTFISPPITLLFREIVWIKWRVEVYTHSPGSWAESTAYRLQN